MSPLEVIEKIKKNQIIYRSTIEGNEAQTRWLLIDPLIIDALGFSREDIMVEYNINLGERVNKYNKIDYTVLINNKPKLLIEAKSYGVNLYNKYSQLEGYFNKCCSENVYSKGELIGILTNGDLYLFYKNGVFENRMDKDPFFSLQLSTAEDSEISMLSNFTKEALSISNRKEEIEITDKYKFYTYYRIEEVQAALASFEYYGYKPKINMVMLRGRVVSDVKTFRQLYIKILKDICTTKPFLFMSLAQNEDYNANGKIINQSFSCHPINSSDYKLSTLQGVVYVSMPRTNKGYIDRIVYIVKYSNYGLHNVMVSLKNESEIF